MENHSLSQSPFSTTSSGTSGASRGERMLHEFPRKHVTNLGGGDVGPVYLTRTNDGKVLFAEAELIHAPFKHMVIDSPEILKMFPKKPTQEIDLNVFDHPWPEFHLVPREHLNFDVARLERVKYVRSGHQLEHLVKGHPYASVMEITPPAQPARRRTQPTVATEVQATRHSERMASKTSNNADVTLPLTHSSPSPSSLYNVNTKLSNIEATGIKDQMSVLKKEITGLLSEKHLPKYEWVLGTGLKRQGKEGAKFRGRVIDELKLLMKAQNERGGELQALHNQYAELQRRLERRWPYHLPHIDNYND